MSIIIGDIPNTIAVASNFSRKLEIPFWEFELAGGWRRAISYPPLDPETERWRLTRMLFDLGESTEQYFACAVRLTNTLLTLAKTAESDVQLKQVINNLPTFYIRAGDIAWEKWQTRHEPEKLKHHRQLMQARSASELGKVSACETVEDARKIAFTHNSAPYPTYDSYTDKALLKMITLADDFETLRDVNRRALPWHNAKFAALRKMLRLPSEKWPNFP